MGRDRDSFALALGRLREDLRDGRIRPGEALTTADLAASLNMSATPVREAIARLTGEGLVQDVRGRGVFALSYPSAEVEELYLLHGVGVALACDLRRLPQDYPRLDALTGAMDVTPADLREKTERFWDRLTSGADGGAVVRTHQRLADQLAVLRLVEPIVFSDLDGELAQLAELASSSDGEALSSAIRAYHTRRCQVSRDISALVRAAPKVSPNIIHL